MPTTTTRPRKRKAARPTTTGQLTWPQRASKGKRGLCRFWRCKNAGRRYRISESTATGSRAFYACWLDDAGRWVAAEQTPGVPIKRNRTFNAAAQQCERHHKGRQP